MEPTDDLAIRVRPGRTLDELVDRVLDASPAVRAAPGFVAAIADEFALGFDHARLACDRALGGATRAATGAEANRPDEVRDPVAASAWRRARGERAATAADPPLRWPALAAACAAGSVAAIRARVTAPTFTAAADADDAQAVATWLTALDRGPRPAAPITAAAIERLVALTTATVTAADGAGDRVAVVDRAGAALALAIGAARDRRGDTPYAPDGTALWFDAVALAEASATLAGLARALGDRERAHAALELHGAAVTTLLGHCPERVGRAMVALARSAAERGDVAAALRASRSLVEDLEAVLLAPPDGPAAADDDPVAVAAADDAAAAEPAFDDEALALGYLLEAIALDVELAGDGAPLAALRARAEARLRAAAAAGGAPDPDRGDLADPRAELAALLRRQQVEVIDDGDALLLPRGVRAHAFYVDLGPGVVQLDVAFVPWTGTPVIESCAGFGPTVVDQRRDAWHTFAAGSLPVLLATLLYLDDDRVERTAWEVDDVDRAVTIGALVIRGTPPAVDRWQLAIRDAIVGSALPEGLHWVRAYVALQGDEMLATEVLLDNQPWDHGQEALTGFPWPATPGVASVRVFLVIQGGLDTSRALAELVDGAALADAEIVATMVARGVDPEDAARLVGLVPLAFGRLLLEPLGVPLAATGVLASATGGDQPFEIASHPIVDEALWLAERGTLTREQFLAVARRSVEVRTFETAGEDEHDDAGAATPLGPPHIPVP